MDTNTYIPILILSVVSLLASLAFFIRKIKRCKSGCCEVQTLTPQQSIQRENEPEPQKNSASHNDLSNLTPISIRIQMANSDTEQTVV